jgi:hypothetical protein
MSSFKTEKSNELMFFKFRYSSTSSAIGEVCFWAKSPEEAYTQFKELLPSYKGKIEDVFVKIDVSQMTSEDDGWDRNVQHLRVEFPTFNDNAQDKEAVLLASHITSYLKGRFEGYRGYTGIVSLSGFYRGDHNWDNIKQQGECVNYPDRGSGDNEP